MPRIWNSANATLFGAIGFILLAGTYLRRHPASTVGPGYHTSDKAKSPADFRKGDFSSPSAAPASPARVTPTKTLAAARSSRTEL
jgi:hypothetical protein